MYNRTVTVFNRYENEVLEKHIWYPHILRNVDLIVDKAARQVKTGLENADKASLHIKYQDIDAVHVIDAGEGKVLAYLPPDEWDRQTNDAYASSITFTEGEDFFLVGEYPEEPIDDDTYRNGLYDFLNKTHEVYKIKSVGTYYMIPHFEIGGA